MLTNTEIEAIRKRAEAATEGPWIDNPNEVVKFTRKGSRYIEIDGEVIARTCTKCNEMKEVCSFNRNSRRLGGVTSICKDCMKDHRSHTRESRAEYVRKYYEANREQIAEKNQKYYQINRDKLVEYQRKYRESNLETVLETDRKYREANREKILEYGRKWYEENKKHVQEYRKENREKGLLYAQIRRAREKQLPSNLTQEQFDLIMNHYGGACALTGKERDVQMDHVIPISIGHGGTTFGNIIPLNKTLNSSKKDANIFEWFKKNQKRFDLDEARFGRMIDILSAVNGMSTQQYRNYVYWCHDNPQLLD